MYNNTNTDNKIGRKIKKERSRLGITQAELGEKLNVSKQTVSNWENGNRTPDTTTINRLAQLFDVTSDYLLGLDHQRKRSTEAADFEENIKKIPPDMQVLFHDFTNMTDEDFEQLKQFAEFLKAKRNKENKG